MGTSGGCTAACRSTQTVGARSRARSHRICCGVCTTAGCVLRLVELRHAPIRGAYDLAHLQAFHRHIFADIHEWAGEICLESGARWGRAVPTGYAVRLAVFDQLVPPGAPGPRIRWS